MLKSEGSAAPSVRPMNRMVPMALARRSRLSMRSSLGDANHAVPDRRRQAVDQRPTGWEPRPDAGTLIDVRRIRLSADVASDGGCGRPRRAVICEGRSVLGGDGSRNRGSGMAAQGEAQREQADCALGAVFYIDLAQHPNPGRDRRARDREVVAGGGARRRHPALERPDPVARAAIVRHLVEVARRAPRRRIPWSGSC